MFVSPSYSTSLLPSPILPEALHQLTSASAGTAYLASSIVYVGQYNSLHHPSTHLAGTDVLCGTFTTTLDQCMQHVQVPGCVWIAP